jgi:hypothetical protein
MNLRAAEPPCAALMLRAFDDVAVGFKSACDVSRLVATGRDSAS